MMRPMPMAASNVSSSAMDGDGVKHPLGLLEGAAENATVVQALLDNLIERGLDPWAGFCGFATVRFR
jgi:hypothetical protein